MAFLAPLGALLFGSAAATTATFAGIGAIASVASASGAFSKSSKLTSLQTPPAAPSYSSIQASESARLLKATQAQTKTILTSPLGVTDPGQTKKKLLLGQ